MNERDNILKYIDPTVRQWCGIEGQPPSDDFLQCLWSETYISRVSDELGPTIWTASHLMLHPLIVHPALRRRIERYNHGSEHAQRFFALQSARNQLLDGVTQEHVVTENAFERFAGALGERVLSKGGMQAQMQYMKVLNESKHARILVAPELPEAWDPANYESITYMHDGDPWAEGYVAHPEYDIFFNAEYDTAYDLLHDMQVWHAELDIRDYTRSHANERFENIGAAMHAKFGGPPMGAYISTKELY